MMVLIPIIFLFIFILELGGKIHKLEKRIEELEK